MVDLTGKRAIVTGASRGIGRAIAARLAGAGARVVACARRPPPAGDALPAGVEFVTADVAEAASVDALFGAALVTLGGLDVLVNNAGIELERRLVDTTEDEWDRVMAVNVRSMFLCTRRAVPALAAAGGGSVVNLASTSALLADPGLAAYNVSKTAVVGLTRSVAVEHGRDRIRCNAIAPGWIDTGMLAQTFSQARDETAARAAVAALHPLGRLGRAEEIASLAAWLASEESAFATGQVFTVDGGLTAASPADPGRY